MGWIKASPGAYSLAPPLDPTFSLRPRITAGLDENPVRSANFRLQSTHDCGTTDAQCVCKEAKDGSSWGALRDITMNRSSRAAATVLPASFCLALLAFASGCSQATEPTASSSTAQAIEESSSEFETQLTALQAKIDQCVQSGECHAHGVIGSSSSESPSPGGVESADPIASNPDDPFASQSIRPKGWFGGVNICAALRPLRGLQHPYFFIGGQLQAGAVVAGQVGFDVVWDMWNQQASTFVYIGGGIGNILGGSVSAYAGYGFGNKAGVIDAWSGTFVSVAASVTIPLTDIGAGLSGFASPDGSVIGASGSLSAGINLFNPGVEVAATAGVWTPWSAGTRLFGNSLWFTRYTEQQAAYNGSNYTYLQFPNAADVALSMVQTAGPGLAAAPAAQVVALSVIQHHGLSIEQQCPE